MNGNIIGEPVGQIIDDQINFRQQIHGAGYIPGTQNLQRTPEVQNYLNNRNAWIKMASGVSLSGSAAVDKLKTISSNEGNYLTDPEIANIQGQGLAENIVLFNSTQRFDNVSDSYVKRSGVREGNTLKGSIDKMYGGLGSNQRGLQPVPGITDISIECLNRGSIRKATVKLKAYNKFQFGVIELLYLRLGYLMMLEWGWDKYINKITPGDNATTPPIVEIKEMESTIIENQWFDGNSYTQSEMINLVSAYQNKYAGNYGGFFGKVSNFQWTLNSDNTYDITINLITLGSVIESLNIKVPEYNIDKQILLERKKRLFGAINDEDNVDDEDVEESDNIILTNVGSDRLNQWISSTILNFEGLRTKYIKDKNYILGGDLAGVEKPGVTGYKTTWKNNIPKESRFFVRFETFLQELQKLAIINIVNGPTSSDSELEFELDTEVVRCNYQTNLIPLNANKVLFSVLMEDDVLSGINGGVGNQGTPIGIMNNRLARFAVKKGDVVYGKLLNCYLNLTFIQEAFIDAQNSKEEVGLFEFLQKICDGINESTGNCTDLEVIVKKDKTVVFIDQNQIKGGDELIKGIKEKTAINIYGYNPNGSSSFVKNFDFKTKITPDLANMVTIGATASDEKNVNSIPFKKWNKGLNNRFGYTQQYDQNTQLTPEAKKESTFKEAFAEAIVNKSASYVNGSGYTFTFGELKIKMVWAEGITWKSNRTIDSKNQELLSAGFNKYKKQLISYKNDYGVGDPNSKIFKNSVEAENNYLVYLTKAFGGDSGFKIGTRYLAEKYKKNEKYSFKTRRIQTRRQDALFFSWDNNDFIQQGKNAFKKYLSNISKEEAAIAKPIISGTGFIPLELSITMDGLTGILIYNRLKIDTKFLPSSYPENLKFIVKGVNHKISNNVWDTNISTISIPVSTEPPIKNESSPVTQQDLSFTNSYYTDTTGDNTTPFVNGNGPLRSPPTNVKPISKPRQKNNIQKVATYLKSAGVTREGAKGLIGNLYYESAGMNPQAVEKVRKTAGYTTGPGIGDKGGFGLAQWTGQGPGERRRKLETAAGENIAKRDSIDFQAEYLIRELKSSYSRVFKQLISSNSIEQSTIIVLEKFEVPGSYLDAKRSPSPTTEAAYNKTKTARIALAYRVAEDVDLIYNT